MPQKINIEGATQRIQSGPIQFFDKMGQLDNPGLYLNREDALSLANAIDALDCHLKADPEHMDSVIYVAYFGRLMAIKDMIRNEVA